MKKDPTTRPAHTRKKNSSGFTLVEVMIALVIFTLSMGGSYALMRWVVHSTAYNVRATNAALLAQDKMEELRNQDYDAIIGGSDVVDRFYRVWSVSSSLDQKRISINVSWLKANQITTSDVQITTIMTAP